jgi:hypothetical protein
MLFRKVIVIYSENHAKYKCTVSKKQLFRMLKQADTYRLVTHSRFCNSKVF